MDRDAWLGAEVEAFAHQHNVVFCTASTCLWESYCGGLCGFQALVSICAATLGPTSVRKSYLCWGGA